MTDGRLADATLGRGHLVSRLTVTFAEGRAWEFDVPTAFAKGAERLAATLRRRST